jgi:Spy/CpxP family protein refolding chaperone
LSEEENNDMKKLLSAIAIICTSLAVHAQEPSGSSHHFRGQMMHHHRFDMARQLNFSDAQKQQLNSVNEDFRNKMKELDKNEDITVREWKQKKADLFKEHKTAIQSLLTTEQKEKMKQMRGMASASMHQMSEKRLEKMKTNLGLNEDQVSKIKNLSEDMRSQIEIIHENNSLSREDKKDQVIALLKQHKQDFKNVLTPEQLNKLEQLRKEHSEKRFSK